MMFFSLQINYIRVLHKILLNNGWPSSGMRYARLGLFIHNNIALVLPLDIDPRNPIQTQVDTLFQNLITALNKNKVTDIYFQGGGTIPIPDFFRNFCRENGIKIHIVTDENFTEIYESYPFTNLY